jgi:hypothetical protein
LQDETERILLSKENEIVNLNIKQIENSTVMMVKIIISDLRVYIP